MISKEEVTHIANLARIKLTEEEIGRFENELSLILGYMEKLKEADTKNAAPLGAAMFSRNVTRKDEAAHDSETAAKLLKEVPEFKDGYVKVKAVL